MSLQPDKKNFKIWRGATFRKRLTLLTGGAGSTPRDLTGHTGELVIRDAPGGTALLTLNTTNGGIVLGGTAGTIDIVITATQTGAITWDTGVYDLTITAGGGDTDALLYGSFTATGV